MSDLPSVPGCPPGPNLRLALLNDRAIARVLSGPVPPTHPHQPPPKIRPPTPVNQVNEVLTRPPLTPSKAKPPALSESGRPVSQGGVEEPAP
jgi:hypothetical protein